MSNSLATSESQPPRMQDRITYQVKYLDVISVGRMTAVLTAILSFFAIGFGFLMSFGPSDRGLWIHEVAKTIGLTVLLPLLYSLPGFAGGILVAVIYNITAGISGGIRIELGQDDR